MRSQVEAWIAQDPRRACATWHNDPKGPRMGVRRRAYRPTTIVQQVLREAADLQSNPRGPRWWRLPDGGDLPTVAGDAHGAAFDWTSLHSILGAIPEGRWMTVRRPRRVVGTAAQPLGQHITRCHSCPNAHRVLGSDGRPREGFRFSDEAETRDQQQMLIDEKVGFSETERCGRESKALSRRPGGSVVRRRYVSCSRRVARLARSRAGTPRMAIRPSDPPAAHIAAQEPWKAVGVPRGPPGRSNRLPQPRGPLHELTAPE